MPVAASVLEEEPQQLTTSFTRRSALLKAAINLSTAEHDLSIAASQSSQPNIVVR
jgi:hypothetical protein